jgi:arginase
MAWYTFLSIWTWSILPLPPGVSHREPGGMSVREAIAHLHAIKRSIVGADIVEYNPVQDVSGLSATVAGRILKEILGKMIAG